MDPIRKKVFFYCFYDKKPLFLVEGKYSWFYRCMNYYREYRKEDEPVCNNCLSLRDQDYIYSELTWLESENALKEGYSGGNSRISYQIGPVSENRIVVFITNKRKTKRRPLH